MKKKAFDGKNTRFLILSSQYFLAGEIERACQRLGVAVKHIALERVEMDFTEFRNLIFSEIDQFQPDAVLTLNHSGVDREGILMQILEQKKIPLISWFVDNPHLLLSHYSKVQSPLMHIFTWDRDNITSLKEEGFENVHYLPLGTDPERFKPCSPTRMRSLNLPASWKSDVSFVGTSMSFKVEKRFEKSGLPLGLKDAFLKLGADFANTDERSIHNFILEQKSVQYKEIVDTYKNMLQNQNKDERWKEAKIAFQSGLTWEATRLYRLSCVEKLFDFNPLLVGDEGWKSFFAKETRSYRWHDAINYYHELPFFYLQSTINFNCTSMQMKNATNQRILDVPACGAFVLTDYREQMEDMFELQGHNPEMAVYRHQEEIPDLIRFYLSNDTAREKIVKTGRKRVLACHTWDHRVLEVIEVMGKFYNTSKNQTPSEDKEESENNTSPQSSFWDKIQKPRFQKENVRLLFLGTKHFLLEDIGKACKRMGIEYQTIDIPNEKQGDQSFIEQLLHSVIRFQPDALFTINGYGLDEEGKLLALTEKMRMPFISWFVDHPDMILSEKTVFKSPWHTVFSWDKDAISAFEKLGCEKVHYLPLATDPTLFRPKNKDLVLPDSLAKMPKEVLFVGHSVMEEMEKRWKLTGLSREYFPEAKRLAESFIYTDERSIKKHIMFLKKGSELALIWQKVSSQVTEISLLYNVLITMATQKYRANCVDMLQSFNPLILGDKAWEELLSWTRPFLHDVVSYHELLPILYAQSTICLNCTSLQMKGAPNQRIFDIPVSGSLVLTDERVQQGELFINEGTNQELVVYKDIAEIPELIRFYQKNDKAREQIIERGRNRVLSCHTWDLRLKEMIRIMKNHD